MSDSILHDVTVYHVDYARNTKIPIGIISERREKDQPENLSGLLKIARTFRSSSAQEAFQTVIDGLLSTRR